MFTNKSVAQKLLADTKKIYAGSHCYRQIDARDFSHLDLKFYERTMCEIEAQGFRRVADVENLTLKEGAMDPQTFLRLGLSLDGTIQTALYQVKPRSWWRIILWLTGTKLSKSIDFETEFADGSFVMTSNAKMAGMLDSPPLIFSEFLPDESSARALLERHQIRVREHIHIRNTQPLQLFSLPEMLESQHRMEKIKSEFRARVGWMKKSEWDRLAGHPNETTDDIYREFTDLQNEN
jgi:hypothetical protein